MLYNPMKTQIFHKIMYDLKDHPGHMIPLLCQNQSSTFVFGPILMKIFMNANIMNIKSFNKYHFYYIEKFCVILH